MIDETFPPAILLGVAVLAYLLGAASLLLLRSYVLRSLARERAAIRRAASPLRAVGPRSAVSPFGPIRSGLVVPVSGGQGVSR